MDSPKGINPAKQGGGGSPVIVAAKEANPLITSEKTENGFERVRLPFSCDNYDLEQVRKIAEALIRCENEGCMETFCAVDAVKHGAVCPLKVVPCKQKCPAVIVRDEMDRHCLTECPMRLVPCPFYQVGCQTSLPQESIAEHCAELLCSHFLYVLQMLHRNQSTQHLTQLAVLLEKSITINEGLSALDIGSLCRVVKEHETKIYIQKQEMGVIKVLEMDAQIMK